MKKVKVLVLYIQSYLCLVNQGEKFNYMAWKRAHASRLRWVEITLVCLGKISANGSN